MYLMLTMTEEEGRYAEVIEGVGVEIEDLSGSLYVCAITILKDHIKDS